MRYPTLMNWRPCLSLFQLLSTHSKTSGLIQLILRKGESPMMLSSSICCFSVVAAQVMKHCPRVLPAVQHLEVAHLVRPDVHLIAELLVQDVGFRRGRTSHRLRGGRRAR